MTLNPKYNHQSGSIATTTSALSMRMTTTHRKWVYPNNYTEMRIQLHPLESALREGCPRTTTGVSQRRFSGHFRQVFFNTNAVPRIDIGADMCLVLVCRGRYGLRGGGSSLHSGIEFGRSRTGEGSSGGRKKGVVSGVGQERLGPVAQESGYDHPTFSYH